MHLAPTPPACGFHGPDVFVAEGTLRDAVAAAAVTERTNWFGPGGTLSGEGADGKFGHLVRYWLAQYASLPPATLVAMQQAAMSPAIAFGQLLNNAANEEALRAAARVVRASLLATAPVVNNPVNTNDVVEEALLRAVQSRRDTGAYRAWSGVFVVSCIRSVAIQLQLEAMRGNTHEGIDALVRASFRHTDYVIEAYSRRHRSPPRLGTYHAFHPGERAVQRGDVIVQDRRNPLRVNGVTRFAGIPTMDRRDLHCDIVTEVNQGEAEAVGGNLSGSVRRRRYPVGVNGQLIILDQHQLYTQENAQRHLPALPDERGRLTTTSTGRIFALLSPVERCAAAVPSVGWRNASGNKIALVSASRGATTGSRSAENWQRSMGATENLVQSPFLTDEVLSVDLQDEGDSGAERLAYESVFQRTLTEARIPGRCDVVERQWPQSHNDETSDQDLRSDFMDRRTEHEEVHLDEEFEELDEESNDADESSDDESDEVNFEAVDEKDENEPEVEYPKTTEHEDGGIGFDLFTAVEGEIFTPGSDDRFSVLVSGYNYSGKRDNYAALAKNRALVIATNPSFSKDDSLVFVWFSVADGKVYVNRRRGDTWKLSRTSDWAPISEFQFTDNTKLSFNFEAIDKSRHYAEANEFRQDVPNTVMSITDVYRFLCDLGRVHKGKLMEFSVLSHGFWNGPILVNTKEQSASNLITRNPSDKDGRGRKDFQSPNLSSANIKDIQDAFHVDGFSWIWGCFVSKAGRAVIQGVADSRGRRTPWGKRVRGLNGATYRADGTTPDTAEFRFSFGTEATEEFSRVRDPAFFPTGVDHFDKTFAEIKAFARKHSNDTYCHALAVATKRPCFGPPFGTSSNYADKDPYRPGTPVVHWVERGKRRPASEGGFEANYSATIEFFDKTMNMPEDPERRGYVRYSP